MYTYNAVVEADQPLRRAMVRAHTGTLPRQWVTTEQAWASARHLTQPVPARSGGWQCANKVCRCGRPVLDEAPYYRTRPEGRRPQPYCKDGRKKYEVYQTPGRVGLLVYAMRKGKMVGAVETYKGQVLSAWATTPGAGRACYMGHLALGPLAMGEANDKARAKFWDVDIWGVSPPGPTRKALAPLPIPPDGCPAMARVEEDLWALH